MKDVEFSIVANQQLEEWKNTDPKIYERIDELLKSIQEDHFRGIGKPEPLRHQLKGYWSRRITREHRLVYKVTDTSIVVASCKYHY